MARIVDTSKLDSIKEVTLHMVVEKGYGGASIGEIAKKAGVADGYLYRFYKSKEELVNDLFFNAVGDIMDNLEKLMKDETLTVSSIVEKLIQYLFDMANKQPQKIKFLFVLMHEYKFNLEKEQQKKIMQLCHQLKLKGEITNEISPDTDEEIIYLMCVSLPIQYINLRFKRFFNRSELTKKQLKSILSVCLKSLK